MDTVKNELDTTKTINQLDNCEKKLSQHGQKKLAMKKYILDNFQIKIGQFPNKNLHNTDKNKLDDNSSKILLFDLSQPVIKVSQKFANG